MSKTLLIHNPRCSKSREAKELLEKAGIEFQIIDYLNDGLKEKLIQKLPELLGLPYQEMIRSKEEIYSKLQLHERRPTDQEWIFLIREYPILLERPIFIHQDKGIIARPANLVQTLL